jgi:lipoyl(octanoyl) transferase
MMQASSAHIRHLGLVDYSETYAAMQRFTKERLLDTSDELWVLQHPPVFTLGLAGNPANLHHPVDHIPLVDVDRGGEITYHGPGQIVIYLLLDLKRKKLFVKELVYAIEQSVIDTLADYGVLAERKPGAPGIYCEAKSGRSIRGSQNCCTWFKDHEAMQLSWISAECGNGFKPICSNPPLRIRGFTDN